MLARLADFGIDGFRKIVSFDFSLFFLKNEDGKLDERKSF